jgi:hypothetical protein
VSPSGKADASGKKDDPVNSISAALAKTGAIRRVYVCEGSYTERVVLKSAISIYGGFKCVDWSYSGAKSVVGKAQEPGYALDVQSVIGGFEIADLEFAAANGNDTFPNSIAARFIGTNGALLRRVKLTAKDGALGAKGDGGVLGSTVKHTDLAGNPNYSPDGNASSMSAVGGEKDCKCPNAPLGSEVTVGGGGSLTSVNGGQSGGPVITPSSADDTGAGGAAGAANCVGGGGSGHKGATRVQATGGPVPIRLGTIESGGWKPESGAAGAVGLPGQGGGGGTGQTGGGAGGACGGCGGFGGKGGSGGGASIALFLVDSPIRIAGELATGTGGRGGDGGDGGDGGPGGFGGAHTTGNGCPGGDGGAGGRGGDASGGAGGLSVGVLMSGAAPTTDGTTFNLGKAGDGGTGKSTNSGPPGVKAETAKVEVVSTKPGI